MYLRGELTMSQYRPCLVSSRDRPTNDAPPPPVPQAFGRNTLETLRWEGILALVVVGLTCSMCRKMFPQTRKIDAAQRRTTVARGDLRASKRQEYISRAEAAAARKETATVRREMEVRLAASQAETLAAREETVTAREVIEQMANQSRQRATENAELVR